MNKTRSLLGVTGALILGVILTLLLLVPLQVQHVQAAQTGYTAIPRVLTLLDEVPKAAAWNTATFQWNDPAGHYAQTTPTEADIFVHLTIDAQAINTSTLTLYASADKVNWASVGVLGTDLVADTDSVTTVNTVGRFFRVGGTAGNTETITVTLLAVLRRDDVSHPGTP